MFPSARQRWLLAAGTVVIGLAFCLVDRTAVAADLTCSGTLLFAANPALAIAAYAAVSVLAIGLALLVAATGSPLCGLFAFGAGLAFVAAGSSIDPWLRHADLPGAYWLFAGETVIWALPVVGLIAAVGKWRDGIRRRLPAFAQMPHHARIVPIPPPHVQMSLSTAALVVGAVIVAAMMLQPASWKPFVAALVVALLMQAVLWAAVVKLTPAPASGGAANGGGGNAGADQAALAASLLGGIVATAIAAGVILLALRSVDRGQIIAAIALAFIFGAFAADQLFPRTPLFVIVLSPFALAIAAYLVVAWRYEEAGTLLQAAWHTLDLTPGRGVDHLINLALAQPIHYASAGLAGAATGLGWSRGITASRRKPASVAPA